MEESQNARLKYSLCYLPIVPIVFFFVESKKTKEFMKHIRYGIYLFVIFIILNFLLYRILWWFLFLIYVWVVGFLMYKTYNWEDVKLDYIDKFEDKFNEASNDVDYKKK